MFLLSLSPCRTLCLHLSVYSYIIFTFQQIQHIYIYVYIYIYISMSIYSHIIAASVLRALGVGMKSERARGRAGLAVWLRVALPGCSG